MTSETVQRHNPIVRACHWLIAVSGLLLCFSGIGFMPLYGRFYLNDLPALHWVSNFHVQMQLHYITAIIFTAAALFHLVYHKRRGERSLLPQPGDVGESWQIIRALLSGQPEPPHGKFLAEQRLAYLATALVSLMLIVTGWVLSYKNSGPIYLDPLLLQLVTLAHMAATFAFMALAALHVAAFALKPNRPLFASMFSGRISRAYARRRHPRWKT